MNVYEAAVWNLTDKFFIDLARNFIVDIAHNYAHKTR